MRKLLILLLAFPCLASDVKLAWDHDHLTPVTFRVYAHTNEITQSNYTNSVIRLNAGTNQTAVVTGIKQGKWWFVATAVDPSGLESDISNVANAESPKPPTGIKFMTIQFDVSGTIQIKTP